MTEVVDLKQIARKIGLKRRGIAHAEAQENGAAEQACALLAQFLAPFRGQTVAGYMPIRTEIDPLGALKNLSEGQPPCALALPVVEAQAHPLRFDAWDLRDPLQEGAYGAAIPKISSPVVPNIVIVPMIAFNRDGHRLGYGGGFYDRTLALLRQTGDVYAVGLAYAGQEMSDFPVSPTDAPLDAIVTEYEVMTF